MRSGFSSHSADCDRERAQAEVARRKAEKKAPKPHGRRDLSLEDLPVEKFTLEPPECLLPGGEALVKIREEVSEHIDRRPASLVRVQVLRPKYKMPEAVAAQQATGAENTDKAAYFERRDRCASTEA